MATKPTDKLDWVSDNDTSKLEEPSEGKKLIGWTAEEKPPFQWFNWIHNVTSRWNNYFEETTDDHADLISGLTADLTTTEAELDSHTANTSNPHSVTKAQVGLGNADNTSDANKPISTATQTALNAKASTTSLTSHTGASTGVHGVTGSVVGTSDTQTLTGKTIDGANNSLNCRLLYDVSGILQFSNGGTGASTANGALNNFLPSQTGNSGKGLVTDGTNTSWAAIVTNPMTTANDMIVAGASGVPARFPKGLNDQILAMSGGVQVWAFITNALVDAAANIANTKTAISSAFSVYRNATLTIPGSATFTTIVFGHTRKNDQGHYNVSTGEYTAAATGWHEFKYGLRINTAATVTSSVTSRILVAGTTAHATNRQDDLIAAKSYHFGGSCDIYLTSGETVVVQVASGSQVVDVDWGTSGQSYFTGKFSGK